MANVAIMMAAAAVSAAMQNRAERKEIAAEDEATRLNYEREQIALNQKQVDTAAASGSERTDRMLAANRRLSAARVVAAQGVGSLDSAAKNIAAGEQADLSRLRDNLDREVSGINDQKANSAVEAENNLSQLRARRKAMKARFFTQVVSTGLAGYAGYAGAQASEKRAENRSSDQRRE
jgi:hypothetical protein